MGRTTSGPEAGDVFEIGPSGLVLLDAVRQAGVITRSALPEVTRLSQQSVHRLTEDLVARGLLRVEVARIEGPGKPSPRLALRAEGAYGLGIAVDTDRVRVSAASLTGEILLLDVLPVSPGDPRAVAGSVAEVLPGLVRALRLPPARIAGLGVSMQGFRRAAPSRFVPPLPLEGWDGVDVVALFSEAGVGATFAENNGTLGALAELWAGAGRRFGTFGYLSFNHGFGGGLVLEGRPWLGAHLNAAEISSIYTEAEMPGRPALGGLLEELRRDGLDLPDIATLRRGYAPGWPGIDRWIGRVTPALRQMIRAFCGIVDPAAIVFGGEAPRDLRDRLIAAADVPRTDRVGRPFPGPELVASEIDEDPSALGAALLPIYRRLFK